MKCNRENWDGVITRKVFTFPQYKSHLFTFCLSSSTPPLVVEPTLVWTAVVPFAVLAISATRSLGNAPLAPAFFRASMSTCRARSLISAWLASSALDTFGDLLTPSSDTGVDCVGVSFSLSEDTCLVGVLSALELTADLSLSPVVPRSDLHSSKVGIRGGRLGGAGAVFFRSSFCRGGMRRCLFTTSRCCWSWSSSASLKEGQHVMPCKNCEIQCKPTSSPGFCPARSPLCPPGTSKREPWKRDRKLKWTYRQLYLY